MPAPYIATVTNHLINVGGKCTWKVNAADIVNMHDHTYVKMNPWRSSLVRLVCDGMQVSLPNASLHANRGIAELVQIRNEAQRVSLQGPSSTCKLFSPVKATPGEPTSGDAQPATSPAPVKRQLTIFESVKRPRVKASHAARAVDGLTITVPSFELDGEIFQPMDITVLRPLRSDDPLGVLLDAESIAQVVMFIRSTGLSQEVLTDKRTHHKLSYEERMQPKWSRYMKPKEESGSEHDDDGDTGADAAEDKQWWD